jgi:hypothetical protein
MLIDYASQVVVMAYVRPDSRSASTGAVASARADVLIPGCTSQLGAAAATAAVAGVSLSKGPSLRWEANITTDPPVTDVWFAGDPLEVTTTWQQRFAPGVRLNASADVALKGATGGAATAKVRGAVLLAAGLLTALLLRGGLQGLVYTAEYA